MLIDRPQITETSYIENAVVASGTSNPANPDVGELFFRTDLQKLLVYTTTGWAEAGASGIADHTADATLHLTSTQNTLLDGLNSTLTSTELNYVDGVTSNIQTQIDARVKLDGTTPMTGNLNLNGNKLTNVGTPTTNTDATNMLYVEQQISASVPVGLRGQVPFIKTDNTRESEQSFTTLMGQFIESDAEFLAAQARTSSSPIYDTRNGAKYEYVGISWVLQASNTITTDFGPGKFLYDIYTQKLFYTNTSLGTLKLVTNIGETVAVDLDALELSFSTHASDAALHLTSGQNTFLDAITVSSGEVNQLAGILQTTTIQNQLNARLKLDGTSTMTGNIQMGSNRITGLGAPVDATDAVNKDYVDNTVQGLSWKQAVVVATVGNITLSGLQTIEGVTLAVNDRVLVKNQTNLSENGIWLAATGAWTRAQDANTSAELDGAAVFVQGGATVADSAWVQVNQIPTLGVSSIVWSRFAASGGLNAGNGIDLSGATVSVKAGNGLAFSGSDLTLNTTTDFTYSGAQLALPNTGVTAGTYGSATSIPSFTVDAKGRITGASTSSISGAFQPADTDLDALAALTTTGIIVRTGAGTALTRSLEVDTTTGLSILFADGLLGNPKIATNATSSNVSSAIVSRDASGNFSAGTITANLSGTATYASYPTFSSDAENVEDITQRTRTGFYQTSSGTTAEGWPLNDSGWQHLITSTHTNPSNYYSMQIASSFYTQNLYFRNTNNSGTTPWSTILHSGNFNSYAPTLTGAGASGSWSISVTGSAGSVAWSNVTSKPTTLSGFGITDGATKTYVDLADYSNLPPLAGVLRDNTVPIYSDFPFSLGSWNTPSFTLVDREGKQVKYYSTTTPLNDYRFFRAYRYSDSGAWIFDNQPLTAGFVAAGEKIAHMLNAGTSFVVLSLANATAPYAGTRTVIARTYGSSDTADWSLLVDVSSLVSSLNRANFSVVETTSGTRILAAYTNAGTAHSIYLNVYDTSLTLLRTLTLHDSTMVNTADTTAGGRVAPAATSISLLNYSGLGTVYPFTWNPFTEKFYTHCSSYYVWTSAGGANVGQGFGLSIAWSIPKSWIDNGTGTPSNLIPIKSGSFRYNILPDSTWGTQTGGMSNTFVGGTNTVIATDDYSGETIITSKGSFSSTTIGSTYRLVSSFAYQTFDSNLLTPQILSSYSMSIPDGSAWSKAIYTSWGHIIGNQILMYSVSSSLGARYVQATFNTSSFSSKASTNDTLKLNSATANTDALSGVPASVSSNWSPGNFGVTVIGGIPTNYHCAPGQPVYTISAPGSSRTYTNTGITMPAVPSTISSITGIVAQRKIAWNASTVAPEFYVVVRSAAGQVYIAHYSGGAWTIPGANLFSSEIASGNSSRGDSTNAISFTEGGQALLTETGHFMFGFSVPHTGGTAWYCARYNIGSATNVYAPYTTPNSQFAPVGTSPASYKSVGGYPGCSFGYASNTGYYIFQATSTYDAAVLMTTRSMQTGATITEAQWATGSATRFQIYISTESATGLVAYVSSFPLFIGGYYCTTPTQSITLAASAVNYIYASKNASDTTTVDISTSTTLQPSSFSRVLLAAITTDATNIVSSVSYPIIQKDAVEDLSNVVVAGKQVGDALTWNGTSWVNAPVSAGSASTPNSIVFNNSGSGDSSGVSFDGSTARTISYNTVGAPKADGTGASGTWSINISGSAGSATSATTAGSAATLTTARDINGVSFNGSQNVSFFDTFTNGVASPAPNTFTSNVIRGFDAYSSTDFPGSFYTGLTIAGPSGVRSSQLTFNWNSEEAAPVGVYFRTNDDTGTTSAWSAWRRILVDGYVATFQDGTSGAPSIAFADETTVGFYRSTTNTIGAAGNFIATGNVGAFSDERIKKNVEKIDNAVSKVQQINGVTFERTDEDTNRRHAGVIAQEVEKVLPEVIFEDETTGMKSVAYGNIVGLLVEAIKELKAEIEELKKNRG